jgi:hypothetical protein
LTRLKSSLAKSALILAVAGGIVAATASAASAGVACNRFGECWHVGGHYTNYPTALGVVFHDDAWRTAHMHGRWHWRDDRPDDHGYYDHGAWRAF